MQYTEDFFKKIIGVGTLGYSLQKIINVLDIEAADVEQFTNDFYDGDSAIAKAYQKGVDKADYAIDIKLFEMAKAGDLIALQQYEQRKRIQQLKKKEDKEDREFEKKYGKKVQKPAPSSPKLLNR